MFEQLNTYLQEFSVCFSRTAAYYWFVTIVVGFIVRRDVRGITSIIRCLNLCPNLYETLLNFFRASSWSIEKLWEVWAKVIYRFCPVVTFKDHIILVGDGIKVTKEAPKMPAVKKLHQESENSGKAKYIFGHHFGFVGMLAGNLKKYFCIPVAAKTHEGVEDISKFKGEETDDGYCLSIVTRMLVMAKQISGYLSKSCILVLDAYYATGPAFMIASQSIDNLGNQLLHIITRAKNNALAYLNEYTAKPIAAYLPHPPQRARTKLPTVWTEDQIESLINAVDTTTPVGKRDYAIILLGARLGFRIGDILNLAISDIDWDNKQISIVQGKTRETLSMPLSIDVGWAIIDYLRNGSPITEYPNIFVVTDRLT